MSAYATPDSLVETSWLAEHLNDPDIRIVKATKIFSSMGPVTSRMRSISIGARI
jgi:3-mercaptopyruvate sulfurtransferase SseA